MKPTIGRIVHFVQGDGQHRPAIIVNLFEYTGEEAARQRVQLVVFHDGLNDRHTAVNAGTTPSAFDGGIAVRASCIEWATSIPHSDEPMPYTWHWPEREENGRE